MYFCSKVVRGHKCAKCAPRCGWATPADGKLALSQAPAASSDDKVTPRGPAVAGCFRIVLSPLTSNGDNCRNHASSLVRTDKKLSVFDSADVLMKEIGRNE